jgi:CHAD domain-containing protein
MHMTHGSNQGSSQGANQSASHGAVHGVASAGRDHHDVRGGADRIVDVIMSPLPNGHIEEPVAESSAAAESPTPSETPKPSAPHAASRVVASWTAILDRARDAATRHPGAHPNDRSALVKTVRKATKTGRALLRLIGDRGDGLSGESRDGIERMLSDAAAMLAPIRDRDAMIETVERLLAGKAGERADQARELLLGVVMPPAAGDDQVAFENALVRRAMLLIESSDQALRTAGLESIDSDDLADGLARIWRRARRRANRSWQGEGEDAHEVRKGCSRLVHQLTLIEPDLPRRVRRFRRKLREVNAALGEEHDLAILSQSIGLHADRLGDTFSEAVLVVCRRGRERLREEAGIALAEAMTLKPRGLARVVAKRYQTRG